VRVLGPGDEGEGARREAGARLVAEALPRLVSSDVASALFDALDALSGEAYERQDAAGSLLLCARGHPAVDVSIELAEPVPLRRTRAARKALELGRGELAPLSDGTAIWGVGRLARPYDPARGDLLEVRFEGRSRWELRHGGETLLAVEGRPAARATPELGPELEAVVGEVLGAHGEARPERIRAAVSAARITVVVSADAPAEARRLAAQGTRIAPRALEPEVLRAATGIGGAILLDPVGVCHAIGVILDGVATGGGERSRGSRFNSAANYVRGRPGTLAVVISDDGSVDLLRG